MHIAADILVHVISAEATLRAACRLALRDLAVETVAFADVAAFTDRASQRSPDCLLLDQDLPGGVRELLRRAREADRRIPVICMAADAHAALVVRAMKEGAVDFLSLPFAATELVQSVSSAIEVADRWREEDSRRSRARALVRRLTPREHAVFDLVLDGLLNKQIASRLGSTEATVKVHRSRLMRKLEVGSIVELIQLALEADRVPVPSPVTSSGDSPARPLHRCPIGSNAVVSRDRGSRHAAASSAGLAAVSFLIHGETSLISDRHPTDLAPLAVSELDLGAGSVPARGEGGPPSRRSVTPLENRDEPRPKYRPRGRLIEEGA